MTDQNLEQAKVDGGVIIKMNKTIKRTITTTKCKFKLITDVDGNLTAEDREAIFDGEINLEKATTLIKKELKDELIGKTFLVSEVIPESKMYEMTQGDFIKYGSVVEEKEETNPEAE